MDLAWISYGITSVSNFSVQYNFQAIAVALIVMSASQCTTDDSDCKDGTQKAWVDGTSSATIFVGAIAGQLSMGYLGDVIGRSSALKVTLTLALFGALTSCTLPMGNATTVYSLIIVCRFFLGVGVGGVYPLSATKAAEDGNTEVTADGNKTNGGVNSISSAKSFFWQAPGQVGPWLVALCLTTSSLSADGKWRLILGLGTIPAFLVILGSMYEQKLQTEEKRNSIQKVPSSSDINNNGTATITIEEALRDPLNWKRLAVSGGGWFLYDVCFYGMELFSGKILDDMIGDYDNISSNDSVGSKSWHNVIAFSMGIPACLITIALMSYGYSLKNIQISGFIMIAFFFVLMACTYDSLKNTDTDALFTIYCFLLFSLSFGPNTTTFVLPATMYPKEIRSTFNGISAACGKIGAVFGAYLFPVLHLFMPYPAIMIICSFVAIAGAILTYVLLDEEEGQLRESIFVDSDRKSSISNRNNKDEAPTASLL